MTLHGDIDALCSQIKHGDHYGDATYYLLDECRSLLRRCQDRLEILTEALDGVMVPWSLLARQLERADD